MIKVLHLVEQNYPENSGGVERYLYFLFKEAENYSSELTKNQIKYIKRSSKSFGIDQPYGIKPQTLGHSLITKKNVNEFITKNQIDLIHAHHSAPFGLSLLCKLAKQYPLILHWHDYFVLCQRTQLVNYQNQICSGPSITKCTICIRNKKSFIKKLIIPLLIQWRIINAYRLLNACAAIVIPQSNLCNKIPKRFRTKCVVIPYQSEPQWELDLGFVKNQKPYTALRTDSWCVLGGPSSHKGILDLIDELKTIDFKGELNIFGDGWNNKMNLPSFAKIRGRLLSRKQLATCSHWIIPSKWQETGPLVAIEAHKMGLNIWARKGAITSDITELYNVSLFEHVSDINKQIKNNLIRKTIPSWRSIIRSYELLYAKLI